LIGPALKPLLIGVVSGVLQIDVPVIVDPSVRASSPGWDYHIVVAVDDFRTPRSACRLGAIRKIISEIPIVKFGIFGQAIPPDWNEVLY
jgi:hypothetical protein